MTGREEAWLAVYLRFAGVVPDKWLRIALDHAMMEFDRAFPPQNAAPAERERDWQRVADANRRRWFDAKADRDRLFVQLIETAEALALMTDIANRFDTHVPEA